MAQLRKKLRVGDVGCYECGSSSTVVFLAVGVRTWCVDCLLLSVPFAGVDVGGVLEVDTSSSMIENSRWLA